jgi:formamidopyrimidine-DNA glycosylase
MHLMIAGRLRWLPPGPRRRAASCRWRCSSSTHGQLVLTEAGTARRASIHLLADRAALQASDPGGMEVLGSALDTFTARLQSENHTLKRALTMPRCSVASATRTPTRSCTVPGCRRWR